MASRGKGKGADRQAGGTGLSGPRVESNGWSGITNGRPVTIKSSHIARKPRAAQRTKTLH